MANRRVHFDFHFNTMHPPRQTAQSAHSHDIGERCMSWAAAKQTSKGRGRYDAIKVSSPHVLDEIFERGPMLYALQLAQSVIMAHG